MKKNEWKVGTVISVVASDNNHDDKRKINLKYMGGGILRDEKRNYEVSFNTVLYPEVFKGMSLNVGLVHNPRILESYIVSGIK